MKKLYAPPAIVVSLVLLQKCDVTLSVIMDGADHKLVFELNQEAQS